MSLCDSCFDPGRCCKRLELFGGEQSPPTRPPSVEGSNMVRFWRDDASLEVLVLLAEQQLTMFAPTVVKAAGVVDGRETVTFQFACSWLLPGGRCGGYEDRPTLCKVFEPGSDRLCVHYNGAEGFPG